MFRRKYRQSGIGKESNQRADKKRRELYPEKAKAHSAVNYAIATGRLVRPLICESCNKRRFVEAHHENYSKPLDVEWLCTKCHSEVCKKVRV
ncbi:hypothetical protein LCGC14_1876020 [marine sediment metagenome]|uniref:HNH domain-containing protein n=1 Tax=marine sediment metagenome TaxID=412755 RepID=A0A0F9G3U4_9ZZZZ